VELVSPLVATQGVVAEVARVQDVASHAAPEHVVAGVPRPAAAEHAAVHEVVPLLARELVGPVAALDGVPAHPAADDVVAAVARDLIGPTARGDHVVAGRAVDDVGTLRADHRRGQSEARRMFLRFRSLPGRAGHRDPEYEECRSDCQRREFPHVACTCLSNCG
jgi:hypothetical protein